MYNIRKNEEAMRGMYSGTRQTVPRDNDYEAPRRTITAGFSTRKTATSDIVTRAWIASTWKVLNIQRRKQRGRKMNNIPRTMRIDSTAATES